MPITQDRMLRLVKAGEAYRDSYLQLQAFLKECVRALDKGEDDGATLLREVEMQMNLLRPDPEKVLPLHAEADHFKRTYKLNQKEKMRQATRRYQTAETLDYRPTTKPERPTIQRPPKPLVEDGTARIGDHLIKLDPTSMDQPPKPGDNLFGPSPKGQSEGPAESKTPKPPKPDWCPSQQEWDEYLATSGGPPDLPPTEPKP